MLTEKKAEAVRLRTEERLSYREIGNVLNLSRSTLSNWLCDLDKLTGEEIASRQRPGRSTKKDRGEPSALATVFDATKLTRFQKGRVAEASALTRISYAGMQAFHAFGDGSTEDIIVSVAGGVRYAKIQVKWAVKGSGYGLPHIPLYHNVNKSGKGRRYVASDFDFIVGYDSHSDTCYVYAFTELANLKRTVSITPTAAEAWDQVVSFCRGES